MNVAVVTLSAENDNKLLDQLKTGFKRTIKWNKYRSGMSNQTKNNNLNHLIDPTFTNVNILSVLTFENEDDRTSFSKYYVTKLKKNTLVCKLMENHSLKFLYKTKKKHMKQLLK